MDSNGVNIIISSADLGVLPDGTSSNGQEDWDFLIALSAIQTSSDTADLEKDKACVMDHIVNTFEGVGGRSSNWVSQVDGIPNQSTIQIAERIVTQFLEGTGSWAGIINDLYGLFGYDNAHAFIANVMGHSGILKDVFVNEQELINFLIQLGIPEDEIKVTVENRHQAGIS